MTTRTIVRLLAVAVLAVSLGWPPASGPALAQEEFPQENAWGRVTPSVVWCGDPESTVTLEIHVVGRQDVTGVRINDAGEIYTLYDDGTHGDARAGDNTFTLSGAQLMCWDTGPRGFVTWWGTPLFRLTDGSEQPWAYGLTAAFVDPRFRNVFQVRDFGNGISATAYAFFIEDAAGEVLNDYPVANVYCGTSNFEAYRRLYSVLPDVFDVALLMPGMQLFRPSDFGENVPYDVLVSNAVRHIGLSIMDHTAQFGSAGRLKSVVYYSFGDIGVFDHEIAHTWGAYFGTSLGLTEGGPGHWNSLSDITGQLGAFYFSEDGTLVGQFFDNGDGTWRFANEQEYQPYSPLELYVMGLIPPEEVPPIHILTSPDLSDPEHVTAASVRTITIDQIMAAEGGPREPSYAESQRDFNLAFIVTQDIPYNDAAYAYFSILSASLMSRGGPPAHSYFSPLYWATGRRATLNTLLPVDLPDPLAPTATPTLPPATNTPFPTAVATATLPPTAPAPTPTPAASRPVLPCLSAALPGAMGVFLLTRRTRRPS